MHNLARSLQEGPWGLRGREADSPCTCTDAPTTCPWKGDRAPEGCDRAQPPQLCSHWLPPVGSWGHRDASTLGPSCDFGSNCCTPFHPAAPGLGVVPYAHPGEAPVLAGPGSRGCGGGSEPAHAVLLQRPCVPSSPCSGPLGPSPSGCSASSSRPMSVVRPVGLPQSPRHPSASTAGIPVGPVSLPPSVYLLQLPSGLCAPRRRRLLVGAAGTPCELPGRWVPCGPKGSSSRHRPTTTPHVFSRPLAPEPEQLHLWPCAWQLGAWLSLPQPLRGLSRRPLPRCSHFYPHPSHLFPRPPWVECGRSLP